MPYVRLAKLSFAERVGRNTVYTLPGILVVAHCSLCRTPACTRKSPCICGSHAGRDISVGFHCEGVGNREHVMKKPTLVISSSKGCSPGFIAQPRTSSQQLPCQESRFTLHLWRLAPTSRLACPCVHASRPLPITPTAKLHPERLHNRNQRCHNPVRIITESSCESREQVVHGCSVVDATVPTIAARRHQGRAAFQSN